MASSSTKTESSADNINASTREQSISSRISSEIMASSSTKTESSADINASTREQVTFLAGEHCLYSVVKRSAASLGWKLIDESAPDKVKRNCHVTWVDRSFVNDKLFLTLQRWQRINHFPGMTNICRKTRLAHHLEILRKKFPREYGFYPVTFILPQQFVAFKAAFANNGRSKQPFIIKPDGAAQGKGIFLTKRLEDVQDLQMSCVAQQYIKNPLLVESKKFDLRIYLLVTSVCPLRLYLFKDGLVRMCTEDFQRPNSSNMTDRCMHLTNYAVNKRSEKYERETGTGEQTGLGSKRSINWLLSWLAEEKGEDKANELWSTVGDICTMTILSILPTLQREYASSRRATDAGDDEPSTCFEILGIDIMIDNALRPHLIEVNHLPSWGTDSQLDDDIKFQVISQALRAIDVKASDKSKFARETKRQSQLRLSKHPDTVDGDHLHQNDIVDEYTSEAKRKQPALFESNSAERRIQAIYAKHAPDKLKKLPILLERFRGYEEWLVMKVQNKYKSKECSSDEETSDCSSEYSSRGQDYVYSQHMRQEELILEGYDRIYPPKGHGRISPSRYKEMEDYIAEVDAQQQRRLLCPLQQIRSNDSEADDYNTATGPQRQRWSRADGWIDGNIHVRKNSQQPKIIAPPTAKQIEFADRLSQGLSTGNVTISKSSLQQRKSRILNHDLIYEEINPFFHLTDRVLQARELSKEARQRAEMKLSRRTNPGVALRQQVVDLGLSSDQSCLRLATDTKFYAKKKYQTR